MAGPKLSIVVPTLNQGRYLAEALNSVFEQSYRDVEVLIVDGGSTDESINIIDRYSSQLAYVCSEPDGGQSAALNKGFRHATGNLLTWLNGDDVLLRGALNHVSRAYQSNPDKGWYSGGCFWINKVGRVLTCTLSTRCLPFIPRLGYLHVYAPSAFFSPKLLQEAGGFDEQLHYVMDTDLWWKFWRLGHLYKNIDGYLWGFRVHRESKTSAHLATPISRGLERPEQDPDIFKKDVNCARGTPKLGDIGVRTRDSR